MSKNLIVGARWDSHHKVQDDVIWAETPPKDWIWWRVIKKKVTPTWQEWEICWRNLSHMQKMGVPIHQGVRLLQYHGPQRLRQSWGWLASLLVHGVPLQDGLIAVFTLPRVWLPLLGGSTINASFLESLAAFSKRRRDFVQSLKKNLRYPLVMSVFIAGLGVVSTLDIMPHASRSSSFFPAWLPYVLFLFLPLLGVWFWKYSQKENATFFRFLELALKAGCTEHEAIYHFCAMYPESVLSHAYTGIKKGTSLDQSLRGIWPDPVVDLVALNTDRLESVVGHIADMVEADELAVMEKWLSFVQSGLIVLMGCMVLWMAYTTLLPLYESLGQLSF